VDELLEQYPVEDKDGQATTDLDWDDANVDHLAAHHITPAEVEQVFINEPIWTSNKRNRAGHAAVHGRTNGGRPLTIIVGFTSDGRIRPVTGWDMDPALRRRFLR
jgi:hypothetical protein